MDSDPQTTSGGSEQPEEARQNRRQFFNGLGKWSLAVIAAVAALREGVHDLQSAIGSRFEIGSGNLDESRQRIAKKKKPHGDQPHIDEKHFNMKEPHHDYYRLERQQGGSPSPGGPPALKE